MVTVTVIVTVVVIVIVIVIVIVTVVVTSIEARPETEIGIDRGPVTRNEVGVVTEVPEDTDRRMTEITIENLKTKDHDLDPDLHLVAEAELVAMTVIVM
jgi:uncharacterized membrane protein YqiK